MKTTLISLASLFIFIFVISFNAPATVSQIATDDIVMVDDTTVAKKDAKACDHTGPKPNCVTAKKDCSSKCATPTPKCCSKTPAKGCCKPKK